MSTPAASPLEWETVEQTTVAMTVGELRAALEHLPAATPVLLSHPTEAGPETDRHSMPATAVTVGPTLYGPGDHLTIRGDVPSGSHRRARRVTLSVTGLPPVVGDGPTPTAAALLDAVERAVAATGHGGARRIRNDPAAGTVRWTWVSRTVALDRVVAAARQAIAELDPGTWQVTTAAPPTATA